MDFPSIAMILVAVAFAVTIGYSVYEITSDSE